MSWNKGLLSDNIGGFSVQQVRQMYWDDGLSLPKIAAVVKRNDSSVFQFMRKHEIATRSRYTSNARRKPKLEVRCRICGRSRFLLESALKKGQGKFCSVACKAESQRGQTPWNKGKKWPETVLQKLRSKRQRRPNGSEVRLMEMISSHHIPLEYSGNGTVWIARLNPDFVNRPKKIAVELFGDYWHSPLLNQEIPKSALLEEREREFRRHGWRPVFVWESELMSKNGEKIVIERLKNSGLF